VSSQEKLPDTVIVVGDGASPRDLAVLRQSGIEVVEASSADEVSPDRITTTTALVLLDAGPQGVLASVLLARFVAAAEESLQASSLSTSGMMPVFEVNHDALRRAVATERRQAGRPNLNDRVERVTAESVLPENSVGPVSSEAAHFLPPPPTTRPPPDVFEEDFIQLREERARIRQKLIELMQYGQGGSTLSDSSEFVLHLRGELEAVEEELAMCALMHRIAG